MINKEKMIRIFCDVLDGCPLLYPCDKLWSPEGWCKDHCKAGQQEPDAECWLKYAEVMTSEAPQAQDVPDINVGDTVSRQEAIDALKGLPTWWADEGGYYGGAQPPMVALLHPEDAVSAIANLSSAQPEIIRCKDCKWWSNDDYRECSNPNYDDGYVTPAGFYCGYAERKTDD